MKTMVTNHAETHARMMEQMLRRYPDAAGQADIWRGFIELAEGFLEVDWERSAEMSRRFHCLEQRCYENALRIAIARPEYSYCEGFATSLIPMEHAWLVDRRRGLVLDPTWCIAKRDDDGRNEDYYGVVISTAAVLRFRQKPKSIWEPAWLPTVIRRLKRKTKEQP